MNSVLLTIDLTKAVADEAIERNDSVIIAYRMLYRCIGRRVDRQVLTGEMKRRSHHLPWSEELDVERHAAREPAETGG